MRRRLPFPLVGLLAAALAAAPAAAQEQEAPRPSPSGGEKLRAFEELVKDARAHEGFLDLYVKDAEVYMAVPADRLGSEFLMEYKIARGIGAGSVYGGTMLNLFEGNLVSLERRGNKVYLVQHPHRFTAKSDPAARRAVGLTFGASVLESSKIASIREDSAVVIPVSSWFLSDLSGISERVKRAASTQPGKPGQAKLDRERSYLESVKAFPRNVNVQAKLTFTPGEPVGMPSVPDGRYIPVSVHYTLAELPQDPMTPRLGDDRVGNFWTVHKDFSEEDSTFFVRLVNRWRLEPGERVGDGWRPLEPIVYYLDPNIPEEYRAPMKAGVEAWNEAFEAAGFVDAIRAEDLPEGADPEDIRYATLRWNVSDRPGYGAIGPSTVDPRTGETLDADILFEASMFMGFKHTWRHLVSPVTAAEALESTLSFSPSELAGAQAGGELSSFAAVMAEQGMVLGATLAARGETAPGDPVPQEYLDQAVKWVTMHEVGHTLGLQHNFRSSASTPLDRLHDAAWAERNGVFSSVMEYPTVNIAPPGQPNGYYYNPGVGSYDRWVIAYAYTPDDARADSLARRGAEKGHLYGTNAEAGGPGALDPSINVYDLSDDPLAWGRQRTEIVESLWARLPDVVLTDGARYHELTQALQGLLNDYARAVAPAIKYIGGQYLNRDHVGDPSGRLPFVNVPKAEQDSALALIVDRVFAADALRVPPAVLERLGSNRWLHWGTETTFGGRLDYPYHEQVLDFQRSVLGQLLHPFRLARIRDAETKFGAESVVTIPQLADALTAAVWSELGRAGRATEVGANRRDLQRAHLDALTGLVLSPEERTPADARSVARMELRELGARIDRALQAGAGMEAYTRAHLEESRARIDRALEAGLRLES